MDNNPTDPENIESNIEDKIEQIQKTLVAIQADMPKKLTKEEAEKKGKRNKKMLLFVFIIAGISLFLFQNFLPSIIGLDKHSDKDVDNFLNYSFNYSNSNYSAYPNSNCTSGGLASAVVGFTQSFLDLKYPLFTKFLIFLGVLYLIQLTFNLALDIIEIVLLLFVIIKKSIQGISSIVKKKKEAQNGQV